METRYNMTKVCLLHTWLITVGSFNTYSLAIALYYTYLKSSSNCSFFSICGLLMLLTTAGVDFKSTTLITHNQMRKTRSILISPQRISKEVTTDQLKNTRGMEKPALFIFSWCVSQSFQSFPKAAHCAVYDFQRALEDSCLCAFGKFHCWRGKFFLLHQCWRGAAWAEDTVRCKRVCAWVRGRACVSACVGAGESRGWQR